MGIFIDLYEAKYKGGKRRKDKSAIKLKWVSSQKKDKVTHSIEGMHLDDVIKGDSSYKVEVVVLNLRVVYLVKGTIYKFEREKGASLSKELIFNSSVKVSFKGGKQSLEVDKMKSIIEKELINLGVLKAGKISRKH